MAILLDSSEHEGKEVAPTTELIESLTRGELDVQIRTARQFPRAIKTFTDDALSLATLNDDVAAACLYALPRGGKSIEGPSARFAELAAHAWGNCRAGARVIGVDDAFITAQGMFFDLQQNVAVVFEVRRRITNRKGERFDDDMIVVTGNAACSIALRNAVLKGIPKALWGPIYDAARETARGKHKSIEVRRVEMLGHFAALGVTEERILAAVAKPAIADVGEAELLILRATAASIKEGEMTIEGAFPTLAPIEGLSRSEQLARLLRVTKEGPGGPVRAPEPPPHPTRSPMEPTKPNSPLKPLTLETLADGMLAAQFAARLAEVGEIMDRRADYQASDKQGGLTLTMTMQVVFLIDKEHHIMVEVATDLKRPKRRAHRRAAYRVRGEWKAMPDPVQGPLFEKPVLVAVEKPDSPVPLAADGKQGL